MSTISPSRGSASANRESVSRVTGSAGETTQDYASRYVTDPAMDVVAMLRDYAHDKPDVAAMWCFGLGVVVGWKIRG